jgi:hypothetical protein
MGDKLHLYPVSPYRQAQHAEADGLPIGRRVGCSSTENQGASWNLRTMRAYG